LLQVKKVKVEVEVTGNKMKMFFTHIIVKSGSIYVKQRTKWSPTLSFYTYRRLHCISGNV